MILRKLLSLIEIGPVALETSKSTDLKICVALYIFQLVMFRRMSNTLFLIDLNHLRQESVAIDLSENE